MSGGEGRLAQWWELAIPTAGVAAAGWLGAWWQGRSSLRLLREQLQQSDRARHEEASIARAAMTERNRQDRIMRLFDERKATYVEFLALADQADKAAGRKDDDAFMDAMIALGRALEQIALVAPPEAVAAARGLDQSFGFLPDDNDRQKYRPAREAFLRAARTDLGFDES